MRAEDGDITQWRVGSLLSEFEPATPAARVCWPASAPPRLWQPPEGDAVAARKRRLAAWEARMEQRRRERLRDATCSYFTTNGERRHDG